MRRCAKQSDCHGPPQPKVVRNDASTDERCHDRPRVTFGGLSGCLGCDRHILHQHGGACAHVVQGVVWPRVQRQILGEPVNQIPAQLREEVNPSGAYAFAQHQVGASWGGGGGGGGGEFDRPRKKWNSTDNMAWRVQCTDARVVELLKRSRDQSAGGRSICDELKSVCRGCLDTHLQRLFDVAHCQCESSPDAVQSRMFLSEMIACLEFAYKRPDTGKLLWLKGVLRGDPGTTIARRGIAKLKDFLNTLPTKDGSLWFLTRSYCMDMYVACRICSDRVPNYIFYGGSCHTRNVAELLCGMGYTRKRNARQASEFAKELQYVVTLQNAQAKKRVLLLGENHTLTRRSFDSQILSNLDQLCAATQKTTFMIEKHPHARQDDMQRELTCNMPDLALHRIRCDDNMNRECPSLQIVSVDTRHVDLGFLRYELVSAFQEKEYLDASRDFQIRAVHDLIETLQDHVKEKPAP